MGFFEHMAAFDDSEREQERTAAAVANRRADSRFGAFVRSAVDANDRGARLSLIEDELRQVVADVVSEYGGDPSRIEASLRTKFAMDPYGPMGEASVPPPVPQEGAVATPGPGGVAPGMGGTGTGLHPCAQGHPDCAATPGGACSQRVQEPDAPGLGGFGQPMGGQAPMYSHTAGEEDGPITPLFGDRAPERQHHPDQEQRFESIDQELADAPSAVGHGHQSAIDPNIPLAVGIGADAFRRVRNMNNMIDGKIPCDQCGAPGARLTNQGKLCYNCYEDNGAGDPSMMDKAKYMLKGGSDSTGLSDKPEPKMDKKRWVPNALGDGNLEVIDTDGGRYKTENQDVTDKAKYKTQSEEGDSFKADSPVVKHEELPSESDNAGFQSGGEEHGDHTDTWSGKKDQVNPVTNVALSSTNDEDDDEGQCPSCGTASDDNVMCANCMAKKEKQRGAATATSLPPTPGAMPGAGAAGAYGNCPNCGGAGCPLCQGQQQQAMAPQGAPGGVPPTVASADVDKNPLREIIESEFGGFLPSHVVQSAIDRHRNGGFAAFKKGK